MLNLYHQLMKKYPLCIIGYVDNGLFMQLSVVHKKYKKNNARLRVVELGQPMQYYADQYIEMIREIKENVDAEKRQQVRSHQPAV